MKAKNIIILLISLMTVFGCRKFLDEKSDKKLVIPSNLTDMQALLDNYLRINIATGVGEASADDYYLTDADYAALSQDSYRRMYTWQGSFLFTSYPNNWSRCYDIIYYTNVVLEGLNTIERNPSNQAVYDNIRGQALFLRGFVFLQAAEQWCKSYDPTSAAIDLGLPLRMSSDFNLVSQRSSVQETYDEIISDLKNSAALLPVTAVHVLRPGRSSAFAALARTYLSMRDYENAGLFADSSLQLYNKLIDYNTLSASATFPFPAYNAEIIYQTEMSIPNSLSNTRAKIDSVLYLQYSNNDLRKTLFFKNNNNGSFGFRGSYDNSANLFGGLATDEMYLIRAECYARKGNVNAAMNDLNTLLVKRWKTGTFIPFTASGTADALGKILLERRKELLMRGIRWSDLKRLNLEGAAITPERIIAGQIYILPPNSPRYALPLPEDIVSISGMPQNPQ